MFFKSWKDNFDDLKSAIFSTNKFGFFLCCAFVIFIIITCIAGFF